MLSSSMACPCRTPRQTLIEDKFRQPSSAIASGFSRQRTRHVGACDDVEAGAVLHVRVVSLREAVECIYDAGVKVAGIADVASNNSALST